MPPKKKAETSTKSSTTKKDAPAAKKSASATATKKPVTNANKKVNGEKTTGSAKPRAKQTKDDNASGVPRKSKAATTKSAETKPPPAAKKRKAEEANEEPQQQKKSRVAKPPKPKVVINNPPVTRLNVYVCGEGSAGELGLGAAKNAVDVKRPRLNPHLPADKVGVVQVAVGGMHCIALTHENKILTWGVNDQGALGRNTAWEGGYVDIDGTKSDSGSSDDDSALNPYESTPTAISSEWFPEGTVFAEVAAGDSSSFALTDDGQVYGWGTFRVKLPLG